jgi:hypothetical protein
VAHRPPDSLLRARRDVGAGRCQAPADQSNAISTAFTTTPPYQGDVVVPDMRREMFFAGVLLQMVPGGARGCAGEFTCRL